MKTRLVQSLLAVSALALLGGCDTDQARTTCRAAGGGVPFATKYIPAGGANPTGACVLPGALLALSSYDPPEAERPSLSISVYDAPFPTYPPAPAGGGAAPPPAIASGVFTEKTANEASTCSVPTLTPLVAGTISYEFRNVDVYVSAANQGTQMKADLTIRDTGAAACEASYKVVGLWPEVACSSDADCGEGSGINPDLIAAGAVSCDLNVVIDENEDGSPVGVCNLKGTDFVKTGGDN